MTMPPENDWDDGPSVMISEDVEETDRVAYEAEEHYYRPQARAEAASKKEPKPRSPFSSRLIYTLIFSISVLIVLVVYALFAGDRIDRIQDRQEALWGPQIEALQNRQEAVEERLKLLEESPKPVQQSSSTKK